MIIGLIPARLNSKRLPFKPLKKINGISLIGHVLKRALKSKKLNKIVVCADSKMISDEVSKYGVETFMTNINIKNGTERIAEYLKKKDKIKKKLKLVVDIQCDEVFLNPKYLDKIISFHLRNLKKYDVVIPHSLTNERNNKNYVKIISDNDNNVLYLSRSIALLTLDQILKVLKDIWILLPLNLVFYQNSNLKKNHLEKYEGVELLRVLENGYKIGTIKMNKDSFSINTFKDFKKAKKIIEKS